MHDSLNKSLVFELVKTKACCKKELAQNDLSEWSYWERESHNCKEPGREHALEEMVHGSHWQQEGTSKREAFLHVLRGVAWREMTTMDDMTGDTNGEADHSGPENGCMRAIPCDLAILAHMSRREAETGRMQKFNSIPYFLINCFSQRRWGLSHGKGKEPDFWEKETVDVQSNKILSWMGFLENPNF